jgi:dihydrofolate reductase
MNALPKIVFSRTLERAEWNNTRLVKGEASMEVSKLKGEPGNDLFIFGSANLASSLTKQGLIDEYRLMVNPVILGRGVPFFQGLDDKLNLKLSKNRSFRNGNVLLYYQPER